MPAEFKIDAESIFPSEPTAPERWWDYPPKDLEGMLWILQTRAFKLKENSEEGAALRILLELVETHYLNTVNEIRQQYPIAFFKPSYEQSLLLNAWIWGIDFVVCFSANRIGKTACLVINGGLWIIPNNPEWEMFAARKMPNPEDEGQTLIENPDADSRFYWDVFGRPVQVLPRPRLKDLEEIRQCLKEHPELIGDPQQSHLTDENFPKFARLQKLCPNAFNPVWPAPPIQESGTIWLGAPDVAYHRDIVLKEWKRWIPGSNIKQWKDSDQTFKIVTTESTNPTPTEFDFICKSYESEDTKWSGSAVYGIILTEGLPPSILDEVKQRLKVNSFASWDYTPYEARNVGAKTALAFKVHKGQEQLPLKSFIFTRFSARQAPAHILPLSKRDDLIRMWDGKAQGSARLDGVFYSSSPLVLSKLNRTFHCLPWTTNELFKRFPTGQIYRGFDPGYDHPTCCCWAMLVPGNTWFIYRYYTERLKTIRDRCADIVRLSGNTLVKKRFGKGPDDYNLVEVHPNPNSEVVVLTAGDYHLFKTDENTGLSNSINYTRAGLVLTESTHMAPKDRAVTLDDKLNPNSYRVHPITLHTPGAQVYFLVNGEGVGAAIDKMESLFWERLAGGPNKGEAKDEVPLHGDDELDATCYLTCGPYVWTSFQPPRISGWIDEENLATL